MKLRIPIPTILLVLLLAGRAASGQSPAAKPAPPPPTPTRAAQARRMMEELRVRVGSPGLSAAVAVDGKVVWAEGLGEADAENHTPVSPDSRFRIGSLSKLLTAAATA